jgi:hypothetical protein
MRCLFQYSLPEAGEVAEGLLDQVYDLAREASEVSVKLMPRNAKLTKTRLNSLILMRNLNGSQQQLSIERSTSTLLVIMTRSAKHGQQRP